MWCRCAIITLRNKLLRKVDVMGYEGSWSGMRKYLEKEMLADSLKGRIRYFCTTYVGMDSCRIFEIRIDDNYKKQFSWDTLYADIANIKLLLLAL